MARWEMGLVLLLAVPLACAARKGKAEVAGQAGQTYAEALDIICHVDQRAGIDPDDDPIGVDGARWDYIKTEVSNPDGVYFRTILQVKDSTEQAELLQSEVDRKNLGECPLAATLETQ